MSLFSRVKRLIEPPSPMDRVIEDALTGKGEDFLSDEIARGGNNVYLRGGGYHSIMLQHEGPPLVNVSRAIIDPEVADAMRDRIMELADRLKVAVVPISETALKSLRNSYEGRYKTVRLVHRQGLEAVFTYGDDYYLTGYDTREDPPLYFLCQLPRPVSSLDEARQALKPPSVVAAEKAGIKVKRQGDLFAIKSGLTTAQIREAGGKIFPDPVVQETVQLYGTSHTAQYIAVLPDGRMLAAGAMIHNPRLVGEMRDPDHGPLRLPGGWWWVARNTVPINGARESKPVTVARPVWNTFTNVDTGWGFTQRFVMGAGLPEERVAAAMEAAERGTREAILQARQERHERNAAALREFQGVFDRRQRG